MELKANALHFGLKAEIFLPLVPFNCTGKFSPLLPFIVVKVSGGEKDNAIGHWAKVSGRRWFKLLLEKR